MTIKELYDVLPTACKNIFNVLNSEVVDGAWTAAPAVLSSAELTALSNNIWTSSLRRDISINIENYAVLNSVDLENITEAQFKNILKMIFTVYKDKWLKLLENVYKQSYNPIWNYDGSNSTTRTYEYGKTNTETKDFSIEHARDSTDTETVTDNVTDSDVYGFNNSSPVGSAKSTNNGERETAYTGSDTDTHSGTDTYAESGVDTERITETKGGNQGTTTTQYMLSEELELRNKFMYFSIISKDIIRELTMNIY